MVPNDYNVPDLPPAPEPAPAPAPTSTTSTTSVAVAGGSSIGTATASVANIGGIVVKTVTPHVPVQVPPFPVSAGQRVYLKPLPGNTKLINVAPYPSAAVSGPCDFISPTDNPVEYPVNNLGEIYITGEIAGEGISINVRG